MKHVYIYFVLCIMSMSHVSLHTMQRRDSADEIRLSLESLTKAKSYVDCAKQEQAALYKADIYSPGCCGTGTNIDEELYSNTIAAYTKEMQPFIQKSCSLKDIQKDTTLYLYDDLSKKNLTMVRDISMFFGAYAQRVSSINISHNKLTVLPLHILLKECVNLARLDASHNAIERITYPPHKDMMGELWSLDVSHNKLKHINFDMIFGTEIIQFNAAHNPCALYIWTDQEPWNNASHTEPQINLKHTHFTDTQKKALYALYGERSKALIQTEHNQNTRFGAGITGMLATTATYLALTGGPSLASNVFVSALVAEPLVSLGVGGIATAIAYSTMYSIKKCCHSRVLKKAEQLGHSKISFEHELPAHYTSIQAPSYQNSVDPEFLVKIDSADVL